MNFIVSSNRVRKSSVEEHNQFRDACKKRLDQCSHVTDAIVTRVVFEMVEQLTPSINDEADVHQELLDYYGVGDG